MVHTCGLPRWSIVVGERFPFVSLHLSAVFSGPCSVIARIANVRCPCRPSILGCLQAEPVCLKPQAVVFQLFAGACNGKEPLHLVVAMNVQLFAGACVLLARVPRLGMQAPANSWQDGDCAWHSRGLSCLRSASTRK